MPNESGDFGGKRGEAPLNEDGTDDLARLKRSKIGRRSNPRNIVKGGGGKGSSMGFAEEYLVFSYRNCFCAKQIKLQFALQYAKQFGADFVQKGILWLH